VRDRKITFSKNCDHAAKELGGYIRIDESLNFAWDSLIRNPYAFDHVETDWFRARYIPTKPFGDVPALVWAFVIESNGDILLDHVEECEQY
jgi:hypothetical protein